MCKLLYEKNLFLNNIDLLLIVLLLFPQHVSIGSFRTLRYAIYHDTGSGCVRHILLRAYSALGGSTHFFYTLEDRR